MAAKTLCVLWDPACARSAWHDRIFSGLSKAAAAAHHAVRLIDPLDEAEIDALDEPVVLIGFEHENLIHAVQRLTAHGKRVILAGMDADSLSSQISCVTHSRSQQTVRLLQYLYGCERKRIALVGIGQNSLNDLVKVDVSLQYTQHDPHPITRADVFAWGAHFEECIAAFLPVWRRYNAVICPNDYAALTLIRHLTKAGVRVPDDLYVVGFSNLFISRCCVPSITTITMDYSALGLYAFSIWQQMQTLQDPDIVCKLIAPSRLIIRESTGYAPMRAQVHETPLWDPIAEKDQFYADPTMQRLMTIESCLNGREELDRRIVDGLLSHVSYEELAERLYISQSALHYHLAKLYRDMGCRTRAEFEALFQDYFGPFAYNENKP